MPEEVADVGAQVAGRIRAFGEDPRHPGKPVDFSSEVEEGTVLAKIDDSIYAADVLQAEAQVEAAKANVLRAQADLAQMQARLQQAENNWKRAQELGPSRALSATDYDSFRAEYETAKATVGVGEATVVQARKSVLQAEAALKRVQTNLGYCTIRSPVKGVIIARRVNIGQTVVASLNAPSLFLIAKDLRRLQVWAAVNEADIDNIHPGQAVQFTVDACPGRVFRGEVNKIRLNASMTQNVVTYTVEVNTDNRDGRLLPYLTANMRFEVTERKDVLMVANAALRWTPLPQRIAPDAREVTEGTAAAGTVPVGSDLLTGGRVADAGEGRGAGRADGKRKHHTESRPAFARGRVWCRDGEFVRPVEVNVGMSDGTVTEIQSEMLQEGSEVVIGEFEPSVADNTTNPFAPRVFVGRRRG